SSLHITSITRRCSTRAFHGKTVYSIAPATGAALGHLIPEAAGAKDIPFLYPLIRPVRLHCLAIRFDKCG
ncbi:MAG: hypothetical protein OXN21_03310, partial [Chloroflexota bacterium]|nr:hypothetical protein [Chloroflexota bacterium]